MKLSFLHEYYLWGAYNPAGRIGSRANSNDALAWTQGANANTGYTANALNRYTAVGSTIPTYDAKGDLTGAGGFLRHGRREPRSNTLTERAAHP